MQDYTKILEKLALGIPIPLTQAEMDSSINCRSAAYPSYHMGENAVSLLGLKYHGFIYALEGTIQRIEPKMSATLDNIVASPFVIAAEHRKIMEQIKDINLRAQRIARNPY